MNKQLKGGVILQYLQMALSILINLIYTPIMIKILGDSEYGIYSLVASIISYLNLLTLGFGASYIRFYTKEKYTGDEQGVAKLNGLYLIVFTIMGLVALVAGLILSFNVGIFFNETYTANDMRIAKILMLFLSFNLCTSFIGSVFVSYVTSQERFIFQKILNIGKTVFSPIVSVILLYFGYGSIGMVLVTTVIGLIIDIINVLYCLFRLKMKITFRHLKCYQLKDIFVFSVFIAINQVIDQINWQTDKIILGKMISSTAVAIYTVAATINSMYINFSTAVSSVFTPKIHQIVNSNIDENEKNKKLNEIFINVGRMQFFILGLILLGFIFFGKFFISKWAGPTYGLSYYIALLLICPATISLVQNIGIEIQRAKNKHQFRSIVYLIMAVLNVVISILLCYFFGNIGTAIGTAISLVVANGIIMNIYYQKKLDINVISFWKNILKIIPSFIPSIIVGILLNIFYNFHGWVDFGILAICFVIIYILFVFLFGCNKDEKNILTKNLLKFRRKARDEY